MINIEETIEMPYPQDLVWGLLSDPVTVVDCVPGAELVEQRADGTYDGMITVQFGPLKVSFRADVTLQLDHPTMSGAVTAEGKDKQATTRFKAAMSFRVDKQGDASASIPVSANVEVTGRLASIVETGAKMVVKRLVGAFSERLTARCAEAAAKI